MFQGLFLLGEYFINTHTCYQSRALYIKPRETFKIYLVLVYQRLVKRSLVTKKPPTKISGFKINQVGLWLCLLVNCKVKIKY